MCAPGETVKETYTKFFEGTVNSLIPNLIFALAWKLYLDLVGYEILSHDTKFMQLLQETEK